MWITCQWVITVWVRPSTRVGWHDWTIKSSTVSLARLVLETSLCSWLGWLKSIRERKWIFYQVGLLAFDILCMVNTSQCGQLSRQEVLHAKGAFNTILIWVIARVTENRRVETIIRTQNNATNTYLHEGRMLRHYSSMVSLRAAVTTKGRHQQTSSLRQHQR